MSVSLRSLPRLYADPAHLKQALRELIGGVSVITVGIGDERTGFTATSAVSLSIEPPTMLVCVNRGASSLPVLQKRRHFCVNILHVGQQSVARNFAGLGGVSGIARYDGAAWVTMGSGASGLVGAVAVIDCDVEEIIERHSHAIVLGAVRDVRTTAGGEPPLVYGHGRFRSLDPS